MSSGMDTYQGDFAKNVIPVLASNVPLKRMGTESEVSSVIASCCRTGGLCIRHHDPH
jgi:hypothetical protein